MTSAPGIDTTATTDEAHLDEDGRPLTDDAVAELAAVEGELDAGGDEGGDDLAAELASAEAALDAERAATQTALARYREAVLAAEPELPPDLVRGETLEELDESLSAARSAVARIRDRLAGGAAEADEAGGASDGGFPVGAPGRARTATDGLTAHEKIAAGLRERAR